MTTSISVQELRDKIAGGGRIVVVDARWSRAKKPYDSYATAHIPLAVFCDPEQVFQAEKLVATRCRISSVCAMPSVDGESARSIS